MGIACKFQSTPPREGRSPPIRWGPSRPGFNPRPRARGDEDLVVGGVPEPVSIHAPARGAIAADMGNCVDDEVSIHAPARGAIRDVTNCRPTRTVSIHAPARGAMEFPTMDRLQLEKFQSTPPREGR